MRPSWPVRTWLRRRGDGAQPRSGPAASRWAGVARRLRPPPLRVLLGLALMLIGAGAVVVSTSFDTPPEVSRLGPVFPVNRGAVDPTDIDAHNSPTVVRSPTDPATLALANRIDTPRYSCALHVSTDGGATWTQRPLPAPKGERVCFAPDVTFAADGTLYMSFVTLRGEGNVPNAAWLVRSTDAGRTFSTPVRVLDKLPFQVRIAADPRLPQRLYVTWLQAYGVGLYRFARPGFPIRTMRTDDGGATWKSRVKVSGPPHERAVAPAVAVGRNGEVYVLYLDVGEDRLDYEGGHNGEGGPPYAGRWQLVLARSRDDGATWEESVVDEAVVPTERFVVFIPPFPSLAIDRGSGKVYVAFQDARHGDPDVFVWSRAAGGRAWTRTRVNDTRTGDGTAQYLPKLAVAPNGRVDVVYYDRRSDRRNVMNEVSLQSSFDGGRSFNRSLRLTDMSFSSRIGLGRERGMPDLGSRLALISADTRAFAAWADTRAGTPASNKQDVARAFVAFSDPPRLSAGVELLLRIGGVALILAGLLAIVGDRLARLRSGRGN
jgi:hypothetical protein